MHTLCSDAVRVKRHATVSTGSMTQSRLVYFALLTLKLQSNAINHMENTEKTVILLKGYKKLLDYLQNSS